MKYHIGCMERHTFRELEIMSERYKRRRHLQTGLIVSEALQYSDTRSFSQRGKDQVQRRMLEIKVPRRFIFNSVCCRSNR